MESFPSPVVVTGGAGFIGSHVADLLLEAGASVLVVDNLSSGRRENVDPRADFRELDIRDGAALRRLADEAGPGLWLHLAAQADVRVSVDDPVFDAHVNVIGTIEVAQAAARTGAPVVFASTGGAIYGEDAARPTPESAAAEPLSPYGVAKLAAEEYLAMHRRLAGCNHAALRFSNVYGPRQDPHGEAGVVAIFCGRILEGVAPTIFGDGLQTRDYVYVGDVAQAVLAAAGYALREQSPGAMPVWNVGSGIETSVLELWTTLAGAAGSNLVPELAPARPGELRHSCLDASLARAELGVAFATPLADGLMATLAHARETAGAAARTA